MTTPEDRAELERWRHLGETEQVVIGSATGRTLLDACNAIEALQAKLDKDHDELRDKRTDLLNIRGSLSPQGRSLGLGPVVPMPLGKDVAPAVEWLVNEADRLRDQISRAREALTEYGRNAMDVLGDLEDGINAEHLMARAESEGQR